MCRASWEIRSNHIGKCIRAVTCKYIMHYKSLFSENSYSGIQWGGGGEGRAVSGFLALNYTFWLLGLCWLAVPIFLAQYLVSAWWLPAGIASSAYWAVGLHNLCTTQAGLCEGGEAECCHGPVPPTYLDGFVAGKGWEMGCRVWGFLLSVGWQISVHIRITSELKAECLHADILCS